MWLGVKKADHVLEGPDWQAAMRHSTRWRMALHKTEENQPAIGTRTVVVGEAR